MRLILGSLLVTIKYTYIRGRTTVYQRAVPSDLRSRYPGANVKQVLQTTDPLQVARLVDALNKRYEAEWAALRASPDISATSLKSHASKLLKVYGIDPKAPRDSSLGLSLLIDHFDKKRSIYAEGDDETYATAEPDEFLSAAEVEALQIVQGKADDDTITEAMELHISTNRKRDDVEFATYARRSFASLVAVTGDKKIKSFTRDDARRFIDNSLKEGKKTGTIRRRLNSYNAIWKTYRLERAHDLVNPFEGLAIPGEGKDAKKRVSFNDSELDQLYSECKSKDDDIRWIIAMLIDTGARMAEVVGLGLDDIKLDAEVPHIVIAPRPWRTLKTASSNRLVPLVGASLWGAKKVVANAKKGQQLAFPRYTTLEKCKASYASNTINGWIVSLGLNHVAHELRHAIADRLKSVECPKEIRYGIDGHAAQDVGDRYGSGFGLKVKQDWLAKVALPH